METPVRLCRFSRITFFPPRGDADQVTGRARPVPRDKCSSWRPPRRIMNRSKAPPKTSSRSDRIAGGVAQESWNPKPDAPAEYREPFGVAKTPIPGIVLSETMPQTAKIADKLTVVRSIVGSVPDCTPSNPSPMAARARQGRDWRNNE